MRLGNGELKVLSIPKMGLIAHFISKNDLIASKIAAGRMRELADVEEIRDSDASQSQWTG
jgi:hypothetical protein